MITVVYVLSEIQRNVIIVKSAILLIRNFNAKNHVVLNCFLLVLAIQIRLKLMESAPNVQYKTVYSAQFSIRVFVIFADRASSIKKKVKYVQNVRFLFAKHVLQLQNYSAKHAILATKGI